VQYAGCFCIEMSILEEFLHSIITVRASNVRASVLVVHSTWLLSSATADSYDPIHHTPLAYSRNLISTDWSRDQTIRPRLVRSLLPPSIKMNHERACVDENIVVRRHNDICVGTLQDNWRPMHFSA